MQRNTRIVTIAPLSPVPAAWLLNIPVCKSALHRMGLFMLNAFYGSVRKKNPAYSLLITAPQYNPLIKVFGRKLLGENECLK